MPLLRRLRRQRIPRILHRIALGQGSRGLADSWTRLHEGWTLRTWTEAELADLGLAEYAARARGTSELSDAVRFEVLRRHGGVCVDADVECLRPIDPLLRGISAFAVLERPGRVGTAMLGCVPEHPAFARAAREVPRMLGLGAHAAGANGWVGSYFFSLLLEQEGGVAILGPAAAGGPSVLGAAAEPRGARRDAPVAIHDLA